MPNFKMRHALTIFCIFYVSACSDNSSNKTATETPATDSTVEKILGERIDGPANIRDTADGKIIFSLNDNILVETAPTENNWLEVGVSVSLTKKQADDFQILPRTDLLSIDGKVIGKTIDTVSVWMRDSKSGYIGAYTHKNNIKLKSIPENCLTEILNLGQLTKNYLTPYITAFNFEKYDYGQLENLTQYFIYESVIVDPSPRDRITLLFQTDKLAGVVHSRPIKTNKFKTYELIRGHKLTITADWPQDQIKNLIDKRIEFYNSVD